MAVNPARSSGHGDSLPDGGKASRGPILQRSAGKHFRPRGLTRQMLKNKEVSERMAIAESNIKSESPGVIRTFLMKFLK